MIEFNKVSNESYFIKNLLYNSYIPLLRTVRENDYIIRDRLYIYKCNIIKCTSSGYIPVKNANLNINDYPESLLRKTDDEKIKVGQVYYSIIDGRIQKIVGTAGDKRIPIAEGWYEENIATYTILGEYYFGERNDKFCRNFLSSSEGYDYKTHEKLGQYLRSLRDMYALDLMPLYNCFSNQLLRNIHITNDSVVKTSEDFSTKVYKVPIRFNTDYTICMENVGMTTFAPAFIHHGTLMKLSNNRFGNNVDATNKYIKLNHNDVIHNEPHLRFKQPIKLRFNNIPINKVINYTKCTYTEIAAQYDPKYYRLNPSAEIGYIKKYVDNSYITIDYNNPLLAPNREYQPGYQFVIDTQTDYSYTPEDYTLSADTSVNGLKGYFTRSGSDPYVYTPVTPVGSENPSALGWYEALVPKDELILPTPDYELYEGVNPTIGTFEEIKKSYKKCPEDETLFNEHIFNNNKTKYYIATTDTISSTTTIVYEQCTTDTVYDPDEIYYYVDKKQSEGWYEFILGEFLPTEDTYIKANKKYYKKEMTEVPVTYNYDITEDNCCMYDYIEDELYLLIQVPAAFNSNIIILEGDYIDMAKDRYYDDSKFEFFSNHRLDHLFTNNLILMETNTKAIRPFSPTLMQFLLWNAICNLDSINNDLDRLHLVLDMVSNWGYLDPKYNNNYWYSRYREEVFKYANEFPKMYIRDNLGYVTKDIERILYQGEDFIDSPEDFPEIYMNEQP